MNKEIAGVLVSHGEELFQAEPGRVIFTEVSSADDLLNDLDDHPHAFVLACIMDRQVKAERAWLIPYLISEKLGSFSFSRLQRLSRTEIRRLFTMPEPLHRFPEKMSQDFFEAIQHISAFYQGNASQIWRDSPPSAEVVLRFLRFRGVGPKVATMATNILARNFKVQLAEYYSVDISVDVHIRRVFTRLGLVRESSTPDEIIYCARALSPMFPGLLDFPAWEIGRKWCGASKLRCGDCYMQHVCPTQAGARAG